MSLIDQWEAEMFEAPEHEPLFVPQSAHTQEAQNLSDLTGFNYAACLRIVQNLEGK